MKRVAKDAKVFDGIFSNDGQIFHKSAMEVFTDREEPRDEVFWRKHYIPLAEELSKGEDPSYYHIISYYGEAGVGKTTLLNKLCQELDDKSKGKGFYVKFDFRNFVGTQKDIVLTLAKELQEKFKFEFPLTSAASVALSKQIGSDAMSEKSLTGIIDSNRGLSLIKELAGATAIGDFVGAATGAMQILEEKYNINIIKSFKRCFQSKEMKALLDKIESANAKELQNLFHVFFSYDLNSNLKAFDSPLVIMFDTYEHYLNSINYGNVSRDKDFWLRNDHDGLIYKTPGIIWIFAGREKMGSLDNTEAPDSWDALGIDEHRIGALSEEDSRKYLEKVGITNKAIQDCIISNANGSPFFLDLCYATYLRLLNSGKEEDPSSYAQTLDQAIDRYFELMDSDMRQLVKVLSLFSDGWTDEMIESLAPRLPSFSKSRYDIAKSHQSFITRNGDRYMVEDNVARVISRLASESEKKNVYGLIEEYQRQQNDYDASNENVVRYSIASVRAGNESYEYFHANFEEKCFHLIKNYQIDEANEILKIFESTDSYTNRKDFSLFISISSLKAYANYILSETVKDHKSELVEHDAIKFAVVNDSAKYIYYYVLSYENNLDGKYSLALKNAKECYRLSLSLYGENHIRTIDILSEMGFYAYNAGQRKDADVFLSKAYSLAKDNLGEKNHITLTLMDRIASTYRDWKKYKEAFDLDKRCYELKKELFGEDEKRTLSTLASIATDYNNLGLYNEALEINKDCYEKAVKRLGEDHPTAISFLSDYASSLVNLGKYKDGLIVHIKCYENRKNTLGESHPSTMKSLRDVSYDYYMLGEYKNSFDIDLKTLELRKETLGIDNIETADSYNDIAADCRMLGDYRKALEMRTKCYEIKKEVLGEKHPNTIKVLNNIAYDYSYLGFYRKSLELHEKCHEILSSTLGEKHPITLRAYRDVSYDYSDLGEYRKSLDIDLKTLELRKETLGIDNIETADSYNDIAADCRMLGDYRKALEMRKKCYEIKKEVLGEKHPDTISILNNIAYDYSNLCEYEKSLDLHNICYESLKATLGDKHPKTISILNDIAYDYLMLIDFDKELELQELCYKQRLEVLGEKHPDTISSLGKIANTLGILGEYKKALETYIKYYNLRKEIFGEKHPLTMEAMADLAFSYSNNDDNYQKALDLYEECYKLSKEILGEKHPDTIKVLSDIADCYENLGNYAKAMDEEKKCYEGRSEVLGPMHPDTLESMSRLAMRYLDLDEYDKALDLHTKCYEYSKNVLGEKHRNTLEVLKNIAYDYSLLEDYEKSLTLCLECYNALRETVGEKDANITGIIMQLGNVYSDLERYDEALDVYKKSYDLWMSSVGQNSTDTQDVIRKISKTYRRLEKYDEALKVDLKLYEIVSKSDDVNLNYLLYALEGLSNDYHGLEKHQEELNIDLKRLAVTSELYGEESLEAADVYSDVAYDYSFFDKEKEIEARKKAYEIRSCILGDNSEETLDSLYILIRSYVDNNDYTKALGLYTKHYNSLVKTGENSETVIKTLIDIAKCYEEVKDYKSALSVNQVLYEKISSLLGPTHMDTVHTFINIIWDYFFLGDDIKAISLCNQVMSLKFEDVATYDFAVDSVMSILESLSKKV